MKKNKTDRIAAQAAALSQQLVLLDILQTQSDSIPLAQLAQQLHLSQRQIAAHLEQLRLAGAVCQADDGSWTAVLYRLPMGSAELRSVCRMAVAYEITPPAQLSRIIRHGEAMLLNTLHMLRVSESAYRAGRVRIGSASGIETLTILEAA